MKLFRILVAIASAAVFALPAFADDQQDANNQQQPQQQQAAQAQQLAADTNATQTTTTTDATATPAATQVNINTADAETIAKELKGTGKRRAEAIVKYREKNGNFKSVDDLINVKGVTKHWLEKNRDKITVG